MSKHIKKTIGIMMALLMVGLFSINVPLEAKAEYYFGSKNDFRVYLSEDDLVTPGHTGEIEISDGTITITGWSYVYGGEFKYGKDGWDGLRGKWSRKKQIYTLDKKCQFCDINVDVTDVVDDEDCITQEVFLEKLEQYKKKKGVCVFLSQYKNKVDKIGFCETGKIALKEKIKKKDYGTVFAKGNFEVDPENYGKVFIKGNKLIVTGCFNTGNGTLKKATRKYTISSKCEYTYEHENTTASKMQSIIKDFRKGKYSEVFVRFNQGKIDAIEVSARV